MADHLRKQIREAAATALTGLATTGSRVFASRARPLQASDLPALRVYCDDESIEHVSTGPERLRERRVDLIVEACAQANADLDDTLDQVAKEVEQALDANNSLGVGVKFIEPRDITAEFMGEGETTIGVARMRFEAVYYTAKGAPDVAL